jgi:hypothetical protein
MLKLKTDLRCGACVSAVRPLFDADPAVASWSADVSTPDKVLTVEGPGVTAERVGELLGRKGYKVVGEVPATPAAAASYYPLVLILLYLLGACGLAEVAAGTFDPMRAMRHFMAGFFLVFSFFKLLDVPAFAAAFAGYDVVARRWKGYGFVYPFVELALGAAYLADLWPVATNALTLAVMAVGTVGVVQSLLARRAIRCACLGTVFDLPMSTVTLVEDVLMAGMAAVMLGLLAAG